jgi:hypothetical protein
MILAILLSFETTYLHQLQSLMDIAIRCGADRAAIAQAEKRLIKPKVRVFFHQLVPLFRARSKFYSRCGNIFQGLIITLRMFLLSTFPIIANIYAQNKVCFLTSPNGMLSSKTTILMGGVKKWHMW